MVTEMTRDMSSLFRLRAGKLTANALGRVSSDIPVSNNLMSLSFSLLPFYWHITAGSLSGMASALHSSDTTFDRQQGKRLSWLGSQSYPWAVKTIHWPFLQSSPLSLFPH